MISFAIRKLLHTAHGQMLLDVSCDIEQGQLAAIYGASGAGKTTILRVLAGLLQPEKGKITVHGEPWLDTQHSINRTPQKRRAGFVFQDYALFPNLTVRQNLACALEKNQDKNVVDELIAVMELEQLQNRYPATLSGGQKQRVALARALVRKPAFLLLDEPLSALDTEMRAKLQDHIIKVHRQYRLTTILVSHNISEIFKMADKIFVLEHGRIKKQGNPDEIFSNQYISGIFQFIGQVLDITKEDIVYIVTVLVNNNIVRVAATEEDARSLKPGDKVVVASKAFNPIIRKIEL